MSYEQSPAGLTQVTTRDNAQSRRHEEDRGRQGSCAGCMDASPMVSASTQALQEEGRNPFSTFMEGLVLTRHQRSGSGEQHCSMDKMPVPYCTPGTKAACALVQASASAQGKGSWKDQPCILSRSSSCLLCYYFLLLHIICTPQQAIVRFHWLFISLNSLWGKISV